MIPPESLSISLSAFSLIALAEVGDKSGHSISVINLQQFGSTTRWEKTCCDSRSCSTRVWILAGFPNKYAAGNDILILIVDELAVIAHIAGVIIAFWDLLGYAPPQLPQWIICIASILKGYLVLLDNSLSCRDWLWLDDVKLSTQAMDVNNVFSLVGRARLYHPGKPIK